MAIEWSEEQKRIIQSHSGNLIVSASAGSGKTAVMLERVLEIIRTKRVPLARIVILAFNNAIAAEIRAKLLSKLTQEAERAQDEYREFLFEQIDSLPECAILTSDAYAKRSVSEFFHILGVDPAMDILNETEQKSLLNDTIRSQLDKLVEEGDRTVFSLIEKLGGKEKAAKEIAKVYEFVSVQPDKEEWLNRAVRNVAATQLNNGEITSIFLNMVSKRCDELLKTVEKAELSAAGEKDALRERISMHKECLSGLMQAKSYSEIYTLVNAYSHPTKINKKTIESADADERYTLLHQGIKELYSWLKEFLKRDYIQAMNIQHSTAIDIEVIVKVIRIIQDKYSAIKQRRGRMDFNDFMHLTIRLLNDPDTAEEIRNRYDYICIDEYQDTNYLQEYLYIGIAKGDNTFMVGDSKQSIYRFRLSQPSIMLEKTSKYLDGKGGEAIRLNRNYRTDGRVLRLINLIFDANMTENYGGVDYAATQRFIAGRDYPQQGDLPAMEVKIFTEPDTEKSKVSFDEVYSVSTDESLKADKNSAVAEGRYIAQMIKSIVGSKQIYDAEIGELREVKYSDIAILAKSRSARVKSILDVLNNSGIPIDISPLRVRDVGEDVVMLESLLRLIDNDEDDLALTSVLVGVLGRLEYQELIDIRLEHKNEKYFYNAVLLERENRPKIDTFYKKLDRWRVHASYMSLYELVKEIVIEESYHDYLLLGDNGEERTKALEEYLDYLRSLPSDTSIREYLQNTDGVLPEIKGIGSDCVATMTVHKSKGLEYPIIFLCDIGDRIDKQTGLHSSALALNKDIGICVNYFDEENKLRWENFAYKVIKQKNKEETLEEAMRLFYVALTRAKNSLILTGAADEKVKVKESYKVNSFLDFLLRAAAENSEINSLIEYIESKQTLQTVLPQFTFMPYRGKGYEKIDRYLDYTYSYENATKTGIKYTVTEINRKDVYEDELDKVTMEYSDDYNGDKARRGTDYHIILENIDYGIDTVEGVRDALKQMSEEGIIDESDIQNVDSQEILRVLKSPLIRYARENITYREKEFLLRLPANQVLDTQVEDDILIQGAIDLIIEDNDGLTIVDFKKSNRSEQEIKKRYSTQLRLYAIAAASALDKPVKNKIIYVIGRDITIKM